MSIINKYVIICMCSFFSITISMRDPFSFGQSYAELNQTTAHTEIETPMIDHVKPSEPSPYGDEWEAVSAHEGKIVLRNQQGNLRFISQ